MNIIGNRKNFYIISAILMTLSIFGLSYFGLKQGIDFKGGSLLEIEYKNQRPSNEQIKKMLEVLKLEDLVVQSIGEKGVILRMKDISEETHQQILQALGAVSSFEEIKNTQLENLKIETIGDSSGSVEVFPIGGSANENLIEEKKFESIGPAIGKELKNRAIVAIIAVLFGISIYISFAFRKASKPIASWKYGVATVIALFHDVLIPTGFFTFYGHLTGAEIDSNFIVALLVVMGFSVHDTIVVFDRIRENLKKRDANENFETVVNRSVNETLARSINTSFTVFLVLIALLFFGTTTLFNFVLVLLVGVLIGTYSSIFVASPILVDWEKRGRK